MFFFLLVCSFFFIYIYIYWCRLCDDLDQKSILWGSVSLGISQFTVPQRIAYLPLWSESGPVLQWRVLCHWCQGNVRSFCQITLQCCTAGLKSQPLAPRAQRLFCWLFQLVLRKTGAGQGERILGRSFRQWHQWPAGSVCPCFVNVGSLCSLSLHPHTGEY